MTDYADMSNPQPVAAPVRRVEDDLDRNLGLVVYALYLLAFFTAFASLIVGVAIAYSRRGDSDPITRGHFDFQLKTFWIVLGLGALSLVLGLLTAGAATIDLFQIVGSGDGWDAWDVAAFDGPDSFRITPLTFSLGGASLFTGLLSVVWLLAASVFGLARLASSRRVGQA